MQGKKLGKENTVYYGLCLSPLFGMMSGALLYVFNVLCLRLGFGQTCFALVGTVIPVLISAGVYLKDFMLTSERLSLFVREKLHLPVGKDGQDVIPGIYGIIAGISYCMLYAGGLSVIWKDRQLALLGIGFIIARALYSMAFVWFPETDGQGRHSISLSQTKKRTLRIIFSVILALCFCTCMAISPIIGVLEALLSMWVWTYYYYMTRRLGGNTQEAAGYFLSLCELAIVLFIGFFGRNLL